MQKTHRGKELRTGFTTGSCATAATKGALLSILSGKPQREVKIALPAGFEATFSLVNVSISGNSASAEVIKDAGDDPDVTNGATIRSTVFLHTGNDIVITGGEGIGTVTKPGLPVQVGESAINPTPMRMIRSEISRALVQNNVRDIGIKVVISIPNGEEIARKTLNPRLGIVGGLSILGNLGIVKPYSSSAFMASIAQSINVARAMQRSEIVMTIGGRSEKYAMKLFPELNEECFIEMGNFIGFSIKQAKTRGFSRIHLVGMPAKFSKIANGDMDSHSSRSGVDHNFLMSIGRETGIKDLSIFEKGNTLSKILESMTESVRQRFFSRMAQLCSVACERHANGGISVDTTIIDPSGTVLGRSANDR